MQPDLKTITILNETFEIKGDFTSIKMGTIREFNKVKKIKDISSERFFDIVDGIYAAVQILVGHDAFIEKAEKLLDGLTIVEMAEVAKNLVSKYEHYRFSAE